MPSDTSNEILIPKVLIIPIVEPASSLANAAIGTTVISGAKLYFAASEGTFEVVTSA